MGEKRCLDCEELLSFEMFTIDRRARDGRYSICRSCFSRRRREKRARAGFDYKGAKLRYTTQIKARAAVALAVKEGVLVRPSSCEACGREVELEGHHEDYDRPLEVQWLCTACHSLADMARIRVDLRLPKELVAAVDAARGDVTRTRWIERALERALETGPSDPGPVEQGASVETGTAPSRASSQENVMRDRQAALNKRMGWS